MESCQNIESFFSIVKLDYVFNFYGNVMICHGLNVPTLQSYFFWALARASRSTRLSTLRLFAKVR